MSAALAASEAPRQATKARSERCIFIEVSVIRGKLQRLSVHLDGRQWMAGCPGKTNYFLHICFSALLFRERAAGPERDAVDWRLGMTTAAMAEHSAGDPIPRKCAVIRVHVTELRQ